MKQNINYIYLIIAGALISLPFIFRKSLNEIVYKNAYNYLGWSEKSEPDFINQIFASLGFPHLTISTSWCAAFVNYILKISGAYYLPKLNARGLLDYPVKKFISLETAKKGDIVILSRGNNNYLGHTGFFDHVDINKRLIYILGGNQSDAVNIQPFKIDRLLAIIRPVPANIITNKNF